MSYNLTGTTASSTYGRLVQVIHGTPDTYYDGFGNLLDLGLGTASVGPQGFTGPQGPQGLVGPTGSVGMIYQGEWDNNTLYFPNDVVSYGGSAWICLLPSSTSGSPPFPTPDTVSSIWSQLVYKGDTGLPGSTGPQGATGPQGDIGPQGTTGSQGATGNTILRNSESTGLFSFTSPGIYTSSNTVFNVASASGWIIKNTGTFSINPSYTLINYPGEIGLTALNISTSTITYLLLNQNAQLIQQNTFPTSQQRRENIYLGKIGHVDKATIGNVFNEPDIEISDISQVRDMFTPIKLINSGVYPSANGANLQFNTSAGTLYGLGLGFVSNNLNPSSLSISGYSPATFQYRLQNGGNYSDTTSIDPTNYDNGGVLTAVGAPTKQATNQRIYLLQNGKIRVQYGQAKYTDLTTAIAALQTESFTTFSNFSNNAILIGVLSVAADCTNLSDTTKARFLFTSKFGELVGAAGGISTTTLQQAYNNSSEPEIITNSSLDGVTFRRGSTSDDDAVIQVQNGSASNTFYVTGNGNTYMSSLHVTNMGLTSGATKYMVIDDSGNTFYQTTIVGGGGATGPAGPTGAGGALGYYGSFYSLQNQNNPTASTPKVLPLESTYESNGVVLYNSSGIRFQYPGTYNIQFSTIYSKSTANSATVDIWFALNGVYLTSSNTEFTIAGQSDQIAAWNFIQTVGTNDYFQIYWSSADTTVSVKTIGTQSNPIRPSVPSVIITAQQIMYTQLGPTSSQGPTGPQGNQGYQGPTGPQGNQGLQGPAGSGLYYVLNETIPPIGVTNGDRWYDLTTGLEYVWINDGDTSQWVSPGAVGPQGSTGSVGPQGSTGSTGNQGYQGPTGPQGNQGYQGPTGPQGNQGYQGPTGPQGNQGYQGPTGYQGATGAQGITGPSGITIGSFGLTIDAGATVIGTGSKGYVTMPYSGTITSWSMLSNTTGSVQIDLKKSNYSNFPTTTSITSGNYIGMTNSLKSTTSTLTGWSVTFSQNDIYEFEVKSAFTMSRVNIILSTNKS